MIGFAGLSHLGIVSAMAAAAKGFPVMAFDSDEFLCSELESGRLPIYEPGLDELLQTNQSRIRFSSIATDLKRCNVVFISADVPTNEDGHSDLRGVNRLGRIVSKNCKPGATIVVMSQVPPGFTQSYFRNVRNRRSDERIQVFYVAETLVIGNAVERALCPERIIIGCARPKTNIPPSLLRFLKSFNCPILRMRFQSAELTKIAINTFLATSVSTTNTFAEICETIGADWNEISPALRLDRRIGQHAYVTPGLGLAGGNLERDLITLQTIAAQNGADNELIRGVFVNSRRRRDWVLRTLRREILQRYQNPILAVCGIAYKPETGSTKNAPSLRLFSMLPNVNIRAYDPLAKLPQGRYSNVKSEQSPLPCCDGAHALIVMTPWKEFAALEAKKLRAVMRGKTVIDPFGILDSGEFVEHGFRYFRLGEGGHSHT